MSNTEVFIKFAVYAFAVAWSGWFMYNGDVGMGIWFLFLAHQTSR